MQTLIG